MPSWLKWSISIFILLIIAACCYFYLIAPNDKKTDENITVVIRKKTIKNPQANLGQSITDLEHNLQSVYTLLNDPQLPILLNDLDQY